MGNDCLLKSHIENIIVIWIDPYINSEENKKYAQELKSINSLSNGLFQNVDEAIDYMKTIEFKETKVILSGRLYSEFVSKFKQNINDMCIAPKIIVFTSNIDKFLEYNKQYKNNDNKFYNLGGIATKFSKIKEFLMTDIKNIVEDTIENLRINEQEEVQLTFEYIDKKEKLLLPMFFKVLLDNVPNENIESYTNILYNTYAEDKDILKILLGSIKSIPNIPIEILSKFYARLYTANSKFHTDLNRNLGFNKTEKYIFFIKTLYEGVKYKSLPLSSNKKLFRGSKISSDEINKIKGYLKKKVKNLPGSIVFSKSFLSFSKNINLAESFISKENKDKNLSKVIFILEKDDNIGYNLSTHGDIEKISFFKEEEEVLFFPFSCFEIKDIQEIKIGSEMGYQIKLLYLGQYLKAIENDKNIVRKENSIPDSKFKEQLSEFGLIKKEKFKNINSKTLYNSFIEYEKDVGEYKIKNSIIFGEINIGPDDVNKKIQIINSFENVKKNSKSKNKNNEKYENEKEIQDNIEIKINGKNIGFSYIYKFEKEGKYELEYLFKNDIIRVNHLFYGCKNLTNLNLSDFNSSKIINATRMFYNCSSLIGIDLSSFETENVNDLSYMFYDCSSLKNLDLFNFETYAIEDMSYMFYNCKSIVYLDLFSFKTENVKDMSYMFYNCNSLISLNISNFKTENVKDMSYMFYNCNSLISLNISNFKTQNVKDMSYMFYKCNLSKLDSLNFDAQNVKNMSFMFSECSSLMSLNLLNFHTKKVNDMNHMFYECKSLINLDLSNFKTKNEINMNNMFSGCSSLKEIKFPNSNTFKLINMDNLFYNCESLINLDLSNFYTKSVTNMAKIFSGCNSLKKINLLNFNTQNVKDMHSMFQYCSSLMSLDISNFETENVTNMSWLFSGCKSLISLDLSKFNTENVVDMSRMFSNCESLISLDLSNFKTQNVENMIGMFSSCNSLKKRDIITDDEKILNIIIS